MARPPAISPSEKAKVVLKVLAGEVTIAEAGRSVGVSGQAVSNWRRQFIDSGSRALVGDDKRLENERERQLLEQVAELKSALGEAYVHLRAQRMISPRPPQAPRSIPGRTASRTSVLVARAG
ncbi:helix-turn-helix domain-containing protein [Streptacidiphilus carbonis]|uniref:helix-turn-helix domain-containing protein n=1 Tax=Streptacidiphilus carbonis TaxID=105422 RepID=UPI0012698CA6|nr:helix-turn-helix domain-containing protein [Streptacidiphilus carbonis]